MVPAISRLILTCYHETLNLPFQDLCNRVRTNPHDSVVHHCVQLGLAEALKRRHPEMARYEQSTRRLYCQMYHYCYNVVFEM